MKKLILIISGLLIWVSVFSQNEELTNQSIIDLVELGFSESVIIAKINSSMCSYDTNLPALKELKEKGVSESIIVAMINRANDALEVEYDDIDDEFGIGDFKTGIYMINGPDYIKILPTVFTGTKTNTLGSALSYGIASSKIKSVINKANSNNVVNSSSPEFLFVFEPSLGDNMGATNWWFATATSPNEFALAKLIQKKKSRELETGSVNVFSGTNIGVSEKHAIPFNITTINDNVFKVTMSEPLEPGEYCFYYQGTIPQGGSNQSVFDFSVQAGNNNVNQPAKKSESKNFDDGVYN